MSFKIGLESAYSENISVLLGIYYSQIVYQFIIIVILCMVYITYSIFEDWTFKIIYYFVLS